MTFFDVIVAWRKNVEGHCCRQAYKSENNRKTLNMSPRLQQTKHKNILFWMLLKKRGRKKEKQEKMYTPDPDHSGRIKLKG